MDRGSPELQKLLEPVITALGYELIGLERIALQHHELLRVYIDHSSGIGLEDCTRVSRQISGVLEVEDPIPGSYTLEVSSPGLERPLFGIRDFRRFIGHNVLIRLTPISPGTTGPLSGRRKINGVIQSVDEHQVVIQEAQQALTIPSERIAKANLHPAPPHPAKR